MRIRSVLAVAALCGRGIQVTVFHSTALGFRIRFDTASFIIVTTDRNKLEIIQRKFANLCHQFFQYVFRLPVF